MKKEEKIIKIRTAAKVELARINAKYAKAEADAARRKSEDLTERVGCCENERFNVIERYKALSADLKADRLKDIAELYENTEKLCEEATEDPEPEPETETETDTDTDTDTEKDSDVTVKGFQPQQTVYCDGSEHTARIVARRLINKLPHIPEGGAITVMISHGDESLSGKYWLSVTTNNGGKWPGNLCTVLFDESNHGQESEMSLIDTVRESFDARKEGGDE